MRAPRRPFRLAWLSIPAMIITLLLGATPASAAPPTSTSSDWPILDLDAHARFTWSLPNRYEKSWNAYQSATGTYSAATINPTVWPVQFDGCSSTSKYRITGYRFTIKQVGTPWTRTMTSTRCRPTLPMYVPAQGSYTANLILTTHGVFDGVSNPVTHPVAVKDYLIVSLGDSLAAGEGNPDVDGSYSYSFNWRNFTFTKTTHVKAKWQDGRCHRSQYSGPARAAKALEASSPHTTVTFVSFACSGAELRHLYKDSYGGIVPSGNLLFKPQVTATQTLLGSRRIDALLVAAGVNDLKFGDIIERCATNRVLPWNDATNCVTKGGIATQLSSLRGSYAGLEKAIRTKLNAPRVYLTDYPAQVFQHGACGLLNYAGHGVSRDEGQAMTLWGRRLNIEVKAAAARYVSWHLVGGFEQRFAAHYYSCNSQSWFVTLERSLGRQGDKEGTAHPNRTGQAVYGQVLAARIMSDLG